MDADRITFRERWPKQHWNREVQPYLWDGRYKGKVEQRIDPQRLGRLRVRVIGVHAQDTPVELLPWASPDFQTHDQGGLISIPRVGDFVWVEFEDGLLEYPKWSGGWWSTDNSPIGKKLSYRGKEEEFGTNLFGGKAITDGPLAREKVNSLKDKDQPNNTVLRTANGKHIELDERNGIEKVRISDQLGNHLWMDTENGVVALESWRSHASEDKQKRGVVFSLKEQAVQLYTDIDGSGWRITVKNGFLDVQSPAGAKIRVSDDDKRVEIWTEGNRKMVLDDTRDLVLLASQDNSGHLLIHDGNVALVNGSSSMLLGQNGSSVQVNGELFIGSSERMYLSAPRIDLNGGGSPTAPPTLPSLTKPDTLQLIKTPKMIVAENQLLRDLGAT